MAKRKSSESNQRALIVGVSDYLPPISKLPGVANDVREMAKLLSSHNGDFTTEGVSLLTDRMAARQRILDELRRTFGDASPDDAVFVYLAGHGSVDGGNYYFVAHDTEPSSLSTTGVPLSEIKLLFERTKSTRCFLWLDFCHAGGILARNIEAGDLPTIERALGVVQGHGKVIVAACTSSQSAYEDPTVGHGLFTHALLRGLRGEAKSAQGEVTAMSLYEFIDHQIANSAQQPVFLGEMTGRIVLMHYPVPSGASEKTLTSEKKSNGTKEAGGTWIMLDNQFFRAEIIRHQSEGKLEVVILPENGDQEAELAALRPTQYGGNKSLSFAANNEGHLVKVEHVTTETKAGKQEWTFSLSVAESSSNSIMSEMTVNGVGPDEIARRRAGRILMNDPPPVESRRGFGAETLIEGHIEGEMSGYPVRECIVRSVYQQFGKLPDWREFARLRSVFFLKVSGTVEHVLELSIGSMRNQKVSIKFRGRRRQRYSNVPPETIEISGTCSLN